MLEVAGGIWFLPCSSCECSGDPCWHPRVGDGCRGKAAECHALETNTKKQGKRKERSEAERKTPGNEVTFFVVLCSFFKIKHPIKDFLLHEIDNTGGEALPKYNKSCLASLASSSTGTLVFDRRMDQQVPKGTSTAALSFSFNGSGLKQRRPGSSSPSFPPVPKISEVYHGRQREWRKRGFGNREGLRKSLCLSHMAGKR